jgi:hypothetical protein
MEISDLGESAGLRVSPVPNDPIVETDQKSGPSIFRNQKLAGTVTREAFG